jgi:hypothetical protein
MKPVLVIAAVLVVVLATGAMAWLVRAGKRWLEDPRGWIE